MAPRTISFGFLHVPLQLLDMAGPMDVLENVSTYVASTYGTVLPNIDASAHQQLIESSLDIKFYHVGPNMEPVQSTGGFLIQPTCTVENCPPLDYLLVGGPAPQYSVPGGLMPESMKEFIRKSSAECKIVFATCLGAQVLASAGVLEGRKATVNHAFLDASRQTFPNVQWDGSANWIVDDKFWTAGGASAGMDMVAEWARSQVGDKLMGLCTMLLEYQPRDVQGRHLSYVNGRGENVVVSKD